MNPEEIESAALKLDFYARAKILGSLQRSLENLSEEEHDKLWAQEAERRRAASSGIEGMREAGEVLAELRAALLS